jgi:hydroxymethylpyrimidine kinase/phosphomethylpyrimidine kinase
MGEVTTVLSIGTLHPWNIAGTGLDLQVGAELGVRVLTVMTAVSAQDAGGIRALATVDAETVRAELESLPLDHVSAVRVGALTSPENVRAVAEALRRLYDVPAVVDPVVAATRGGTFADEATLAAIRDELLALPNVIATPNIPEAARLLGVRTIERDGIGDAARRLQRFGMRAALLTGGHLEGNPVDALATHDTIELFAGTRLALDMRGSGCVLAMALAAELADGHDLPSAVRHARVFVRKKIETARQFGDFFVAY